MFFFLELGFKKRSMKVRRSMTEYGERKKSVYRSFSINIYESGKGVEGKRELG